MTDTNSTPDGGLPSLVVSIIGSLARHGLTYLAGLLGTAGALSNDQQTQLVGIGSSLALAAASFVWSVIQKKTAAKKA